MRELFCVHRQWFATQATVFYWIGVSDHVSGDQKAYLKVQCVGVLRWDIIALVAAFVSSLPSIGSIFPESILLADLFSESILLAHLTAVSALPLL